MTITEKRKMLVENQAKLAVIDKKAVDEKRDLTKDEQIEFDKILDESEGLRTEIIEDETRSAKLDTLNNWLEKPSSTPKITKHSDALGEHRNLGEWFSSVEVREQRAASMGNGASGGLLVPEQFASTMLSLSSQPQIVRPRATVIPAGDPPDAKITIPVFNQQGSKGADGGMDLNFIDEGGTLSETNAGFGFVELEPKEFGGYTVVTEKLMRNLPAFSSWINTQFGTLVNGKEDYAFLRGNGVGQPRGVLGCKAEKTVTRATASEVNFADIVGMLESLKADSWGNAVWIASQTALSQMLTLTDSAGNTLFIQGDVTKGIPASLFGIPLVFTGKMPTLGNKGDLMLVDFSYYLIKDGSGPYVASSEHVYFTSNKIVMKIYKLVDGNVWVQSTLLLEDEETEVSPIVTLV